MCFAFLLQITVMWWPFLTIAVVFYIIYRLLKFWIIDPWLTHRYLWAQGIPGKYTLIVGESRSMRRAVLADDPMSFSIDLNKRFGHYYHISLGPLTRLVITDPSLIQGVLKTNARCYHKSTLERFILGSILGGENLLLSEDNIHAQHRRLIAPVFQHQKINSMTSLMVEITSLLLESWSSTMKDNEMTVDIHKEMTGLTLDIVTGCVFGSGMTNDKRLREIIYRAVTTTLEDVEERTSTMVGLIPIINRLPLASKRRIDQSRQNAKQTVQQIIDERKKGLSKSACKGSSIF